MTILIMGVFHHDQDQIWNPRWKQAKKKEREREREKRKSGAVEARDSQGREVCGLSVGYCVGSVIRGKEWYIIIQSVKLMERHWEVNQMTEEPMIPLFPSIGAPKSTPVKPGIRSWKRGMRSSRLSASHHYRYREHGAVFTPKSERGMGVQWAHWFVWMCGCIEYYLSIYDYIMMWLLINDLA